MVWNSACAKCSGPEIMFQKLTKSVCWAWPDKLVFIQLTEKKRERERDQIEHWHVCVGLRSMLVFCIIFMLCCMSYVLEVVPVNLRAFHGFKLQTGESPVVLSVFVVSTFEASVIFKIRLSFPSEGVLMVFVGACRVGV